MKNYKFKINYRTDCITKGTINIITPSYETYHQALNFVLGYISEMQQENKNDRMTEIKIEKE